MSDIFYDFETYSECDIKLAGAVRYAEDPTTRALCLAIKPRGKKPFLINDFSFVPMIIFKLLADPANTWHAWNVHFDAAIWHHCLHVRHGWPYIPMERLRDTAAKAAACCLPRNLDAACKVLGSEPKDSEGHALMIKICKPAKPLKNNPDVMRHHTPANLARLGLYCLQDVIAEESADDAMGPQALTGNLAEVEAMDRRLNANGILADVESAKIALEFGERWALHLENELRHLTGGMVSTGKQAAALRVWLMNNGCQLDDLTAKTVSDALKAGGMPEPARRVLELRQNLARSSTAKLPTLVACAAIVDRRMRGLFRLHGADSGRWTGNLFQPQNLPRGSVHLSDSEFELAHRIYQREDVEESADLINMIWGCDPGALGASMIRQYLRAKPGKEFLAADYSAVEARGVFWLSGCKLGLQQFKDGVKLYEYMGGQIYGKDPASLHPKGVERFAGKQAILSGGYGAGWKRFQEMAATFNVILDDETCQRIIKTYRTTYHEIPELWKGLESAAVACVQSGQPYRCGRIKFTMWKGKHLRMWLPSGRAITFNNAEVVRVRSPFDPEKMVDKLQYMAVNSLTKKWGQETTYGGMLTGYAVQGLCCDLMSAAMLRAEAAGYKLVMTVHDEIVAEMPTGERKLSDFIDLLTELPEWAEGFPLKAEGFVCQRYHK